MRAGQQAGAGEVGEGSGVAGREFLGYLSNQRNTYRGSEDFTTTLLKQAIIMNSDRTTTHHMQ